jgi:hypothetical protein
MPPPAHDFSVPFSATAFPPGVINGPHMLHFDADDLAHALFTTGRVPGDVAGHGMSSVWEWIHRASLMPSYVRRANGGRLVRSALALELDRSEKVALSYALGQALTSIFCEQTIGVTFLMHVDRYASRYGTVFGVGRTRPDLIGRAPLGWVVAEAKGRSMAMENDLRSKLEGQKRSILSIEGAAPWLALGCVASFPPPNRTMKVDAFDPTDNAPEAIRIDLTFESFLRAYYEPFAAAVDFGELRDGTDAMIISDLAGLGMSVGIPRSIYSALRSSIDQQEAFSTVVGRTLEQLGDGVKFPDGTLVSVEWDEALSMPDWALDREREIR